MDAVGAQTTPPEDAAGFFPATRWSRVVRARETADSAVGRLALEELCAIYWRPVVNYLTALGCGQDAPDVAQDFFASFLRREGFNRANPELGRLRALLKTSVRNHFLHWRRDRATLQRGGGVTPESLDATTAELAGPAEDSAASTYDCEWALTVLERALGRLREYYAQREKAALFDTLKPVLFATGQRLPDAQAAQLGLTLNALTVEQHRARRRFADLLREEVADTIADARDLQEELMHLLRVLARTDAIAHE